MFKSSMSTLTLVAALVIFSISSTLILGDVFAGIIAGVVEMIAWFAMEYLFFTAGKKLKRVPVPVADPIETKRIRPTSRSSN